MTYNFYTPTVSEFYDLLFYFVSLDEPFFFTALFGDRRLSYSYNNRVLYDIVNNRSYPIIDKAFKHYYNTNYIPIYVCSSKKNIHRGTFRICPVWSLSRMSKSKPFGMGFKVYL